jgi:hypothetical protein
MTEYNCQECYWSGEIKTESEADENRRHVETTDLDHCPVCGRWGLVEN